MTGPKRHVAFFNIPATGHITPTLGVVEELVRRGHRVTYAATDAYADLVRSAGATALPYSSSIDPQTIVPAGADDWLARVLIGNVREGVATAPVFEEYFADDLPDVLAYDISMQFLGGVLTRKWNRPGVKLYSVSPTNRSIPREAVGPAYDTVESELTAFAAAHGVLGATFDELVDDPQAMNLVTVPRAFQYRHEDFEEDRFSFVGPCLRQGDFAAGGWSPPTDGPPVLVISLGTSFNVQHEFFRACLQAVTDTGWHTVLITGPGVERRDLGPLPENVEVHGWLPLQAVLPHARVFLCHGGWGTVMHSLHAGVPMVVVPQVGETDELCHQLTALGLGHVLYREDVTPTRLWTAVTEVDRDPDIRGAVSRMRTHVHEAGGAVAAADVLLDHLDRFASASSRQVPAPV